MCWTRISPTGRLRVTVALNGRTDATICRNIARRVQGIIVSLTMLQRSPADVYADVLVAVDAPNINHSMSAACTVRGEALLCQSEGTPGSFMLEGRKGGALLLTVGRGGLDVDAHGTCVMLNANPGDNREFLIPNVIVDRCM